MICLIQLLDYEGQRGKEKKILECKDCIFRDKCKERSRYAEQKESLLQLRKQ